MPPLVTLRDAAFGYRSTPMVRHLNLLLQPGERVALVGPSGGGKSLVSKGLAALRPLLAGYYEFAGALVPLPEGRKMVRAKVAVSFQHGGLLDGMSARENVILALREGRGLSREESEARAAQALRAVGLEGHEHKSPEALSGGMRKRVSVARAIAVAPDLLVLDDPTAGLDPITSRALLEELAEVLSTTGAALIVATADPALAKVLTDRVVFVGEGTFLADGPWKAVESSDNERVRRFFDSAAARNR